MKHSQLITITSLAFLTLTHFCKAAPSEEYKSMRGKYSAEVEAMFSSQFEKGKYYSIGGDVGIFKILQAGENFILAGGVDHDKPWGILTFGNPKAIEDISIPEGSYGIAVGKFVAFKDTPMRDGSSQRFPIFLCVGFQMLGGPFVNTEAPEQPEKTKVTDGNTESQVPVAKDDAKLPAKVKPGTQRTPSPVSSSEEKPNGGARTKSDDKKTDLDTDAGTVEKSAQVPNTQSSVWQFGRLAPWLLLPFAFGVGVFTGRKSAGVR